MNRTSCDSIGELLVEYADGELSAADAGQVAGHLAGCPRCREELRLLARSLEVAREIWAESVVSAGHPGVARTPSRRRPVAVAACVAVCVAVLLLTAGLWPFLPELHRQQVEIPEDSEQTDHIQLAANGDLLSQIAREGRSARLAAVVQLLGSQPGLELYKDQAERYWTEAYQGTVAVGRASESIMSLPIEEPES